MPNIKETAARGQGLKRLFVPNGDGSYAEIVVVKNEAGGEFATQVTLASILSAFESKSNYGQSTGAALTVDLDSGLYGGRLYVEVWVKSSAAATFTVKASRDGTNWRDMDTITLSGAGEEHKGYSNAAKYIRVITTAANDNEIEIWGSR